MNASICAYIYMCICVFMYLYMHVYVCVYVTMYMHMYTDTASSVVSCTPRLGTGLHTSQPPRLHFGIPTFERVSRSYVSHATLIRVT